MNVETEGGDGKQKSGLRQANGGWSGCDANRKDCECDSAKPNCNQNDADIKFESSTERILVDVTVISRLTTTTTTTTTTSTMMTDRKG